MADDKALDPSTPSLAHDALAADWAMIRAIMDGVRAVKKAGETYLIRYPKETQEEYDRRLRAAPWRPVFEDIVRGISSKPFAKPVALMGTPSEEMKAIAEDVDGRGNNLHSFAKTVFEAGITQGACGILVDYPTMQPGATRADERAANARPYWVKVAADEIIALRTERRGAIDVVTHLRLREVAVEQVGFAERADEKIRVLEPGLWQLWHQVTAADGTKRWEVESSGELTLDRVPFVFYATGERHGAQYVRPPLLDLANMQIELYNQLSNEEAIYTVAGAPMLTANGMAAPGDGEGVVETGPGRVLFAPGGEGIATSWAYLQPDAANLDAISRKSDRTADEMRRLGLQPMLPRTGTVTATASGIEGSKAHSALQAWTLDLKDALEQAYLFTAKWLQSTEEVEVSVHTDFAVGVYGVEEVKELREARKQGDLSRQTYWEELARHGVLGPAFDPDQEEERLLEEGVGEDTDEALREATLYLGADGVEDPNGTRKPAGAGST